MNVSVSMLMNEPYDKKWIHRRFNVNPHTYSACLGVFQAIENVLHQQVFSVPYSEYKLDSNKLLDGEECSLS